MQVTKISYGKTINLGDYENERIDVEVFLEDGETPSEAFERAKRFVNSRDSKFKKTQERKLETAQRILENKDNYSFREVISAEKYVSEHAENESNNLEF